MSRFTLTPDGPEPYLLSLRGPKDQDLNEAIKPLPGVAWDQAGLRWLIPLDFAGYVASFANIPLVPGSIPVLDPRLWLKKELPPDALLQGRCMVLDGEKFCNPESQRTKRLNDILKGEKKTPLVIAGVDPWNDPHKVFYLLELVYPCRYGRWPEQYAGKWRFLERYGVPAVGWNNYTNYTGLNDAHFTEYSNHIRFSCFVDPPPERGGSETPITPRGLFE